jgi:hypothetical protein
MFTLVAFTVAEIPLISYLATPAKTLAVVLRLHDWISTRRQAITAVVVGAFGVLLVVTGIQETCPDTRASDVDRTACSTETAPA